MKRKCLRCNWTVDPGFLTVLALTVFSQLSWCTPARALQEVDRQYALDTLGVLRSWDNVDGLFGDYVGAAYREYFANQNRFLYIDLAKADPILANSKIPYGRLIEDEQILKTIGRAMRAQTILRTRVYKEGPNYRFQLDWIHLPKVDVLASDTFQMEEPKDGKAFGVYEVRGKLFQSLDRLVKQVPFVAQVTGRDANSVTVNLTDRSTVAKGDTLVVSTLEEVKKHPLLKKIVDWRFRETGRLEVESIDGGIAFCKIIDEQAEAKITRYQKITQIIPAPEAAKDDKPGSIGEDGVDRKRLEDGPPLLGYIQGGVFIGGFSRDYSTGGSSAVGRTGGGTLLGARAEGQLWLNRDWFADLGFGYGFSSYEQKNSSTGVTTSAAGVTANVFDLKIDAGYNIFSSSDFFGPKGWAKIGYRTINFSLPTSSTEYTGGSSFGSLFLGIGGDLPIRGVYGALFNLDFGVLNSATESGLTTGVVNSSSDVEFMVGGYYRIDPRMSVRAIFDVKAESMDFSNGASLSHKVITFGPSLVIYF